MNTLTKTILVFLSILIALAFGFWQLFGPSGNMTETQVFTIPQENKTFDLIESLSEQGLIKNKSAFQLLTTIFIGEKEVKPGGYRLNQKMTAVQVLTKLTGKPDLLWVTISFCPRKEQVGEKLAGVLGWDAEELTRWNTIYTNSKPEYFEGVYYPDTYLLPTDEPGEQIAGRLINHFNEKFAPLADEFVAQNIKWTTGLKIASLIAREAAGPEDMQIISGIIWNRLNLNMPLQIDATMQYTLGKSPEGSWWGTIDIDEKQSDSPYNSYRYKGLPPTPICSPNITAIEAVLYPQQTECLYYLHDKDSIIHCAKTYQEHLANIDIYLR